MAPVQPTVRIEKRAFDTKVDVYRDVLDPAAYPEPGLLELDPSLLADLAGGVAS